MNYRIKYNTESEYDNILYSLDDRYSVVNTREPSFPGFILLYFLPLTNKYMAWHRNTSSDYVLQCLYEVEVTEIFDIEYSDYIAIYRNDKITKILE